MEYAGAVELSGGKTTPERMAHATAQLPGAEHIVVIHGGQNDSASSTTYGRTTRKRSDACSRRCLKWRRAVGARSAGRCFSSAGDRSVWTAEVGVGARQRRQRSSVAVEEVGVRRLLASANRRVAAAAARRHMPPAGVGRAEC